ncbi:Uracil DNA glycosylase superfamily protein [Albimonas pacifica]|uniref:Uracil DNA glycosylase superfamily protein n=2 Tax=Albimonas pacifica TaxID=1114924 RepID=A0A1I3JUU0_9RHOB|nr:Uracil DNA glycosylase superfamily protein [Albimonas pacifica]
MAALTRYVEKLRAAGEGFVPDFDPLDGGVDARALFLLEKPGPMTDAEGTKRVGSGFISRDNDDPTAEAIFTFMDEAGWDRRETLLWNVMPWWNGRVKFDAAERRRGLATLGELRALLPRLETVVFVGGQAARAKPLVENWGVRILECAHPSARVRNLFPEKFARIPVVWKDARLGSKSNSGAEI